MSIAELYEFRYGDGAADIIRYTSADTDVVIGADTYTAISLERDQISEEGDPDDGASMDLTIPWVNTLADLYRVQPPQKVVTVKIRAVDRDDPGLTITALWSGRVVGVSWEYPEVVVGCERISTSLKRTMLRARYQRQCRHVHYGAGCGLNKVDWEVAGLVTGLSSDGKVLNLAEAAGFTDGYFNGGFIEVGGVFRLIVWHVGDALTLNRMIVGLSVNDAIKAYPGCGRSAQTCLDKFNNIINYGGTDFIPPKGPFEGSSLV